MSHLVKVTLEGLPPTTNHLYINVQGRGRVLSPAARTYKAQTLMAFRLFYSRRLTLPLTPQYLAVDVLLFGNWHNKDGTPKRTDADGRLKALLDCLSDWLGVDDRWFFRVTAEKVQDATEQTEVTVWTMPQGRGGQP